MGNSVVIAKLWASLYQCIPGYSIVLNIKTPIIYAFSSLLSGFKYRRLLDCELNGWVQLREHNSSLRTNFRGPVFQEPISNVLTCLLTLERLISVIIGLTFDPSSLVPATLLFSWQHDRAAERQSRHKTGIQLLRARWIFPVVFEMIYI